MSQGRAKAMPLVVCQWDSLEISLLREEDSMPVFRGHDGRASILTNCQRSSFLRKHVNPAASKPGRESRTSQLALGKQAGIQIDPQPQVQARPAGDWNILSNISYIAATLAPCRKALTQRAVVRYY